MKRFHNCLTIQASKQLTLPFLEPPQDSAKLFDKRRKPQISCIPGISPSERRRYRVTLGDKTLASGLSIDEALKLAKGGYGDA